MKTVYKIRRVKKRIKNIPVSNRLKLFINKTSKIF